MDPSQVALDDLTYIQYNKRDDKIAEIVFDRAEKKNAINDEFRYEILAALDDAERDDDINVLIIKANGDDFSAGHDLGRVGTYYGFETSKGAEKKRRPSQRTRLKRDREALSRIYHDRLLFSWVPIIVQIQGLCIGGASILQLACDISIAADDASIGYTEQRLGFAGTAMDLALMTMACGQKRAQDLLLGARMISGKEAADYGLVSRSVPADKLEATVEETAKRIAKMPRDGLAIGRAAKEMTYTSMGLINDRVTGYVMHSMFTNLRWEEDEFNFFKERRDDESGYKGAMHRRNEFFERTE